MAEEKKAEAQKPKEVAPAPQGQAAAAPVQAQAPAQAPDAAKKKNKKISQMSVKEVDDKLNEVKEKMGRLDSRYAKELLKK